jgi:outer membrane protein TolC
MLRILLSTCLMLIISSTGWANDIHLSLEKRANEVLMPKQSALSLEQVQQMVANDDIDAQIAYEKLLQAQRKIGEARAQFFPYGLGTVGAMYLLNIWNPILLVELVTSIPSKVFSVQSEKNMSMAEKYSLAALRENVKNQIAHLYYDILKEEAALKLTKIQISLHETLLTAFQEKAALGLSNEQDVKSVERRLLTLRDAYLKFSGYLAVEKSAFNMMMARNPSEAKSMELQPVTDFLDTTQDKMMNVNGMISSAVAHSNEIMAADYMIAAASKNRKSIKWSILTFNGIGFGYWARVQVAGSQIREAQLNRQLIEENLVNQVYVAEKGFRSSLELLKSEQDLLADTEFYMNSEIARFKNDVIPVDELIETELIYLKDFNELLMAHYSSLIKLSDLDRVVMNETETSDKRVEAAVEVKMNNYKRNWYSLSLTTQKDSHIKQVDYSFTDKMGLRPMTSYSSGNGFGVNLKLYTPDSVEGTVTITYDNGSTATKTFKF